MASALGNVGVQKFDGAKGNKKLAKVTVTYIGQIASAVGEITGDPQLVQIGQILGQVSPRKEPPAPPMPPVAPPPMAA